MKPSAILLCFLLLCVSTACATNDDWEAQPAVISPVPTAGPDVFGPDPSAENILRGTRGKSIVDTVIALEDAILKTQKGGLLVNPDNTDQFVEDLTTQLGKIVNPAANDDGVIASIARFLSPRATATVLGPDAEAVGAAFLAKDRGFIQASSQTQSSAQIVRKKFQLPEGLMEPGWEKIWISYKP